jgi:hypothetical protein
MGVETSWLFYLAWFFYFLNIAEITSEWQKKRSDEECHMEDIRESIGNRISITDE